MRGTCEFSLAVTTKRHAYCTHSREDISHSPLKTQHLLPRRRWRKATAQVLRQAALEHLSISYPHCLCPYGRQVSASHILVQALLI